MPSLFWTFMPESTSRQREDAPLPPSQAAACHTCTQIPWALSATGVGYNVPGIGHKLNLTGSTLAGIYLGQITNWDSPAIKKSDQSSRRRML